MTRKETRLLATLLIVALSALTTYLGARTSASRPAPTISGPYPVVKIVDGDTLDVMKDGEKVRVRLIGINAPESVDPNRPVQCFGKEASAELARVAAGHAIALETDPSQDTYDKYGRLLAYVFASTTNLNLHLVQAGFAHEYTYDLPYKYQREFRAAEREARETGRGLWAAGVCGNQI